LANIIEYKGYQAKIEYSSEDKVFFGKVLDISDTIIFEINNSNEVESVFKNVIDDYLDMCSKINKEPSKKFSGNFNVRISPELHKKAVKNARLSNITLNKYIENAIEAYANKRSGFYTLNLHFYDNYDADRKELSKIKRELWTKSVCIKRSHRNVSYFQ
jgi:predicted HicB family RNase H-like nuclease